MTASVLFRQVAKQIHPDLNNGDSRFNDMMRQAIENRNDTDVLLRLARQWGLNIDGSFNSDTFDTKAKDYSKRVYEAVVGAIIKWVVNYKRKSILVRGVITKVRPITKGKYQGAVEYSIYDFQRGNIWKTKAFKHGFDVIGMADDNQLEDAIIVQDRIKDSKKRRNEYYQDLADNQFRYIGLKGDKDYNGMGYWVYITDKRGYGDWWALDRTTKKCVYARRYGNSKRFRVKDVINVKRTSM